MLRGQKPLLLYKIVPEEFSGYADIKPARITDYIPHWREVSERIEYPLPPVSDEPMYIAKADADKSNTNRDLPNDAPEQLTLPMDSDAKTGSWIPEVEYTLVQEEPETPHDDTNAPPSEGKYGALQQMGEASLTDIREDNSF
jgi:hypothetical protein